MHYDAPAQQPHPPVHVGGAGHAAIRRAVRYGDGWVPLMAQGDDDPVSLLPTLEEKLGEAGRKREGFEVTIYFCPPDPDTVARCRDSGIDRVLFPMPSVDEEAARPVLDGYAALMAG